MLIWSRAALECMQRGTEELVPVDFIAAVNRAEWLARHEFLTVPGIRWDYQVEPRHWRGALDEAERPA